ncbi:MAG: 5'-3' exonuclease, partial [Myxococcota bacterium]
ARYAADDTVEQILLCSPDKDLAQCVVGDRVVLNDRRRKSLLNEAGVLEKFGVPPRLIPDYLALVGDAADGIPGIPRFGPKSAAALLAAHGSLDAIPDDPTAFAARVRGAPALADSLSGLRDEARLYRTLATLRTDVPLDETLDDLRYRGEDIERMEALTQRLRS